MNWKRRVLGLTWRNSSARVSLLICCVLSALFLAVNILTPGRLVYGILTALVVVSGVIAFAWAYSAPERALQTYWWGALATIACMVAIDAQTHAADGLPAIVAIPSVATALIRLCAGLPGLRASFLYAVGVVALLIPTALVYGHWGEVAVLAAVSVLAGVVRMHSDRERIDTRVLLAVLAARMASARKALDEITS